MIYVGIDIAKLNHFASAISSDGEELIKPFKFTNDNDGFQLLLSKLDPLDKDSLIIGLESTAHYGDNLVRYLVAKNYKVCVLNPIKTSAMRKSNIHKTKTDKVDTYIICKALMMQESLRFVTFYDLDLMDLKALGRFRQKTIKQRTRLKIQLTSYVDEIFPELQYFFKSGLHQKSVYALLKEAPTPKAIASLKSLIKTDIMGSIDKNVELGNITAEDGAQLYRFTQMLYTRLYSQFEETEEVTDMVEQSIITFVDVFQEEKARMEKRMAEMDKEIADKDKKLADKDNELAELRAEIARLKGSDK